ncbi:MAG: HDOD domain-containing protein [Verrucomicrobiales bacterium]|nr:HDOD domain-containing protein [Verrucomicrobiales bacterium]
MKTRILFVDDEQMVLSGLQRMLRPMRQEWEMVFANSGAEALALAATQSFEVIVSDMRMPGMNGAQLLQEMMRLHPRTARFILSGYADKELIMQCTTTAHQFLSKPCDAEVLISCIKRVISIDARLENEALKAMVSGLTTLPSLPKVYAQLNTQLENSRSSSEVIGRLIAQDPSMTAKVLQLVNSAFFGLQHQVVHPVEAVGFLGFETVKALVLWVHIFGEHIDPQVPGFSMDGLSRHCLMTATLAREIIVSQGHDQKAGDEAFTAGLLHDIGKLILAINLPQQYGRVIHHSEQAGLPRWRAECDILGVHHAELGAYLIGLWGLPYGIVEAVGLHHHPSAGESRVLSAPGAVHIANALVHELKSDDSEGVAQLDEAYLARIDCLTELEVWRGRFRLNLAPKNSQKACA